MNRPAKVSGALLALSLPIVPALVNAVEPTFGGIVGAVVRVDATIMPGAQTIRSLGKERSGVVIGDDGLILTIGYPIMESATLARCVRRGLSRSGHWGTPVPTRPWTFCRLARKAWRSRRS